MLVGVLGSWRNQHPSVDAQGWRRGGQALSPGSRYSTLGCLNRTCPSLVVAPSCSWPGRPGPGVLRTPDEHTGFSELETLPGSLWVLSFCRTMTGRELQGFVI